MTPPGFIRVTEDGEAPGPLLVRVSEIRRVGACHDGGAALDVDDVEEWLYVKETVDEVALLMCAAIERGGE